MFERRANTDEGFRRLKESYLYDALQLSLDLADLIIRGMRREGINQKELSQRYRKRMGGQSFVSRLVHADANSTFRVAARVLRILGIRPKLVDADEWEELQALKKRLQARATEQHAETRHDAETTEHGSTSIGTAGAGANVQIRITDTIGYLAGIDPARRAAQESGTANEAGHPDHVGGPCTVLASNYKGGGPATLRYARIFPDDARAFN